MKKNAFTLIELLAVIVILAIIAVIAVLIVINIINDAKESAKKQSIELYGRALENAISAYYVKYPDAEGVTKKQLEEENLIKYNGEKVECEDTRLVNGKVNLLNCSVNGSNVDYQYGQSPYNRYITLVSDADNDSKISPGDEYKYQVNSDYELKFYILSIDDNKVNLIMDKNICKDGTTNYTNDNNYCKMRWHDGTITNNYGPDTAMKNLYEATKEWINVPDINVNFDDIDNKNSDVLGYKRVVTNLSTKETTITGKNGASDTVIGTDSKPLKSRLPYKSEILLAECKMELGTCSPWLINNLSYYEGYTINSANISGTALSNIKGYWLMDSYINHDNLAYIVAFNGSLNNYGVDRDNCGIRPVITLSISDLEK